MESNKDNIPLSFKAIHQEIKDCAVSVGEILKKNLTEKFGFKKDNLDTIFCFYEIWFFLLSGVDIRCHSFLKNNEVRERLFIYLIDEMFSDLGIETANEKNIIIVVGAMNIRLKEYENILKKSKTADEFNKNINFLFIQRLTYAIMKKEFLNEPNASFILQEGIITMIYGKSLIFYFRNLGLFLDAVFATNEQFCFLDESEISTIKKETKEKIRNF